MSTSRLSLDTSPDGHLLASGVIDAHTADTLGTALGERSADTTLDLNAVDFIDSSGLRVIVSAHQRFADAGAQLTIVNLSEAADRLFEITGLKDHLHLS